MLNAVTGTRISSFPSPVPVNQPRSCINNGKHIHPTVTIKIVSEACLLEEWSRPEPAGSPESVSFLWGEVRKKPHWCELKKDFFFNVRFESFVTSCSLPAALCPEFPNGVPTAKRYASAQKLVYIVIRRDWAGYWAWDAGPFSTLF